MRFAEQSRGCGLYAPLIMPGDRCSQGRRRPAGSSVDSRRVQAKHQVWTGALILAVMSLIAFVGCEMQEDGQELVAPRIIEPAMDGQIVHPADVHMETAPFTPPDAETTHLCSDWEIWTVMPEERVWAAMCVGGLEKVHTHLGDGVFEHSHADRRVLFYDTDYRLRVRHQSNTGEVTAWAERLFRTSPATEIRPLELDDVTDMPAPQLVNTSGEAIVLPPLTSLRVTSAAEALLLELQGSDGGANLVMNPPPMAQHTAVRIELAAGENGGALILPASELIFPDDTGTTRHVYLPAVNVPPGQQVYFWVAANGSTFDAEASQTTPDLSRLARGSPIPWTVVQPGFEVEIVASGFQLPVNIAFVPAPGPEADAPLFYVAELYGTIKVVSRDGTVSEYATDLLNFDPTGNFPGSGEQGLTGLMVDPATGDVYASLLYSIDPSDDAAPHYPRVIRLQSADGGRTADVQTVILDMFPEEQGPSHQISHLSIGVDGKLYVHMGDGLDITTAQDPDAFRGKILRLHLDGSAAADNPFYDASDGISARDYIYASGFRNPFGGAWRAVDGSLYEVENGPSIDRLARVVAGRDYGWAGDDADMFTFALYNWPVAVAPVNITFVQPETFMGSGFPADKMDHAFVSESGPTFAAGSVVNGKRISEFGLDEQGNLLLGPVPLIEYNGTGHATAVALAAGPDGLYFSDFYTDSEVASPVDPGANILRVRFTGEP
jgi:glucose/arabinose dehydrogenase